jgi:crotonobetainyl-CoA:carnitine CoA-transferase CaiB-like acyl-CoA transferase
VRPPEALRNDAQLRARGFYVAVPHPELSTTLTYPGAPYVFSRTPWCIHRRPPLLGEHAGAVWHAGEEAGSAASRVPHSSDPLSSRRGLGPSTADRQPLRGLRVLDFTWVVAGPLATRILADHGAEVIKVERPGAGDFGSRRGGLTGNLNRGKRSIVIDMGNRVGLQLAQRLAAASDVVIDNFSARVMSNWGLDDGRLRELNPRIVAVHMSGFGRSGPARDHVSYGPTLQALCGHTWLMRSRGEPVGWGFSYSDLVAGVSAAFAVLAALWHRRRTGEGQCIDLSQFENLTALLGPGLLNLLVDGGTWPEIDNGSQEVPSAPHGVYRCADRAGSATTQDSWCAISVCGEQEWGCFQRAIGDPAWTRAPEFVSAAARRAHRTALDAHVEAWTRPRAAALVAARLQACGVRAGVVADARVLCCSDPHLLARQYWVHLHTPEGEPVALDGVPMKLSDTSACVRTPGPLLGEHTDPVLREVLGMTAADIAALRHTNVVA